MKTNEKNPKLKKAGAAVGAAAAGVAGVAAMAGGRVENEPIAEAQAEEIAPEAAAGEEVLVAETIVNENGQEVTLDEVVVTAPHPNIDGVEEVLISESEAGPTIVHEAEPVQMAEAASVQASPVNHVQAAAPEAPMVEPEEDDFGGDFIDETDNTYLDSNDDYLARRGVDGEDEDTSFLADLVDDIKEDIHNLF